MADSCEEEIQVSVPDKISSSGKKKKPIEAGVVYLSTIPPSMSVKQIRETLSKYGEIGRIFLQPEDKGRKKKPSKNFTEGWIEFKNKKVAKRVAASLNNTIMGGKKKSKFYDYIWNVKYLHRFRWTHLNEKLAYEKAVHQQRMRAEIAQVKRETNFYIQSVEKSKKLEKLEKRIRKEGKEWKESEIEVKQFLTNEEMREILNRKKKLIKLDIEETKKEIDKSLLSNIFVTNDDDD